ncbi:hypothetical protein [Salipaludibacillus sp. LMS25]|jgi:hypothetical protein|nr:hypothetical protein [Salipaludibacillus sp. LMS25]
MIKSIKKIGMATMVASMLLLSFAASGSINEAEAATKSTSNIILG